MGYFALVLSIGFAVLGGCSRSHVDPTPNLVVSITFDDGKQDNFDYAAPLLEAHGMRGTFFVIRDVLDFGPYMKTEEVFSLHRRGHEIGGHSLSHLKPLTLGYLPLDQIKREVCDSRARWLADGIPVHSFAYPWGADDGTAATWARACGYNSARIVSGLNDSRGYCERTPINVSAPHVERLPPDDPFHVRGAGIVLTNSCTLVDLQNAVVDAESHLSSLRGNPGWLVLVFHQVCPESACASHLAVGSETFDRFLGWLALRASRGTVVKTVAQALGGPLNPPVASGTPLVVNGSFESYIANGSDGAPDCWMRTSTSASSSWSRVPGRSGWAQEVVASSLQAGVAVNLMQYTSAKSACAVPATPGNSYTVTCWYKSDVPIRLDARQLLTANKSFPYWTKSEPFPASPWTWSEASWTTPSIPEGTFALSIGAAIDQACAFECLNGQDTATMVVDDCTVVEN